MRQAPLLPNRWAVELQHFHKFTWRERLKILIGWNAIAMTKVLVDRRNASVKHRGQLFLTQQQDAEGQIQAESILQDADK